MVVSSPEQNWKNLKIILVPDSLPLKKQMFLSQHVAFAKQRIICGFIDNKNKEALKQDIFQAVLIRIEEHSEHCCCIIGAYNWI